ncbi:MAG: sulfotransferase domain-containing protein [Thermodesulfobacteriota bacterium]
MANIKDKIISSGLKHKELLKRVPLIGRVAKRFYRWMVNMEELEMSADMEELEMSPGTSLGAGWHGLENDGQEPFRWTSACANIVLDEGAPAPDYIVIKAASAPFEGKRYLTVGNATMEIWPDWRYYIFPLGKAGRPEGLKIVSSPPLSVGGDHRELGVMVKSITSTTSNKLASAPHEYQSLRVEQLFLQNDLKVVWLASYPRSGNTWSRFLLTNLLFKRVEKSAEVPLYIPDIAVPDEIEKALRFGDGIFEGPDGQRHIIMKSHFPYSERIALGGLTAGAVYLIRNPLDVVVSNAKYDVLASNSSAFRKIFGENVTAEQFYEDTVESMVIYGQSKLLAFSGFGTWQGHVSSWLELARLRNRFPVIEVKYELLKEDTRSQLAAILKLLGLSVSRERIEEAIELSSLSRMKEMQEREIKERIPGAFYTAAREESLSRGMRFINKGMVGTGGKELTPDQRERAIMLFSNVMRKFGYLD